VVRRTAQCGNVGFVPALQSGTAGKSVPHECGRETEVGAERERVTQLGRLEDGLRQGGEWYRWAVCERAAVGHGAGGLQRGRQRVGLPAA
jgi:hypothetical protein